MKPIIKTTLLLVLFLCITNAQAPNFKIEVSSYPANSNHWWLKHGNGGTYISNSNISIESELKKNNFEYFSDFFYQKNNGFTAKELYLKYYLPKNSFIRIGKYYRDFSLYLNDNLSSGSMLVSKNAEAMPKVGFVKSQKINENYFFNFGISHGFFDKSGRGFDNFYPEAPFLHEKFLYLNFSNNNIDYGIGIVHEAIWGGSTKELGKQPSTISDFLKIFISADGEYEGGPHANALGSHLGIWDFFIVTKNSNKKLKFYYQHFFEDTSSLRFANKIDGLWGFEIINYIPNSSLLIEYLDTSNCCIDPPYQDDNYYSNYQYVAGWTYQNYVLGNPFIRNTAAYQELIELLHIGFNSSFNDNEFEIKISKKINEGDLIKYFSTISKSVNDDFNLNIFLFGDKKSTGLGIGLEYLFD